MPTASNRSHIRIVQSRQNSRVKELRAAFARPGREGHGCIAIEGIHLVAEALRCGLRLHAIFLRTGSERLVNQLPEPRLPSTGPQWIELPPEVFDSAVLTESPQGIAALVDAPVYSADDLLTHGASASAPLVVVAAGLQDPGNLGTLVRSAEAFGATGMMALPGTVSQWNAKALRASSGSAFRLPVLAMGQSDSLKLLREHGVRVLAASAGRGTDVARVDLSGPVALLIGNEGAGLSASLVAQADELITIPCPGPVESLNAAVAASVLLYEAARQRRLQPPLLGRRITSGAQ